MEYFDMSTGILIADSAEDPLSSASSASSDDIRKALSGYILSVSGWRAVFAPGGEEDFSCDIRGEDAILAAAATEAFFRYLGKESPRILIGSDARPTGRILTAIAVRIMIALGADVSLLGIASAPEIMAYSGEGYDGFLYISASHNPVGHNGFKFGKAGGVLPGPEAEKAKAIFLGLIDRDDIIERMAALSASVSEEAYAKVLSGHESVKRAALGYYEDFVLRIAHAGHGFRLPFGVAVDFNGSARSASIDIPFLRKYGCRVWALNGIPGQIDHAIVPEGENLEPVRETLERIHMRDPSYIIGYMPDNDGDRGNFVYTDDSGKALMLDAQRVFALVAAIDLVHARMLHPDKPAAIAVNGPTSLLVDEIAAGIGAEVFRSDIGEANVVMLAENLRQRGYMVPVCGEGSNGGIIAYPSKVRDPMNSLMTIAKLWSVPGLYGSLMDVLCGEKEDVSIGSIVSAFPPYYMTPSFSRDAVLRIESSDFDALKEEYEALLVAEIGRNMASGAVSYEVRQYEGSTESTGIGPEHRPHPSSGGYKVQFLDGNGKAVAYLWLSRSRTEPVCRIMVNVRGADMAEHDRLLAWQRSMAERADILARERAGM